MLNQDGGLEVGLGSTSKATAKERRWYPCFITRRYFLVSLPFRTSDTKAFVAFVGKKPEASSHACFFFAFEDLDEFQEFLEGNNTVELQNKYLKGGKPVLE